MPLGKTDRGLGAGLPTQGMNNTATPEMGVQLSTMSWDITQVPLEGVEPPTFSLGRNRSSIELQRRAD